VVDIMQEANGTVSFTCAWQATVSGAQFNIAFPDGKGSGQILA
jgi:hypothetical protein